VSSDVDDRLDAVQLGRAGNGQVVQPNRPRRGIDATLLARSQPGQPVQVVAPAAGELALDTGRQLVGMRVPIPFGPGHGDPPPSMCRTVTACGPAASRTRTGRR